MRGLAVLEEVAGGDGVFIFYPANDQEVTRWVLYDTSTVHRLLWC